MYYSTQHMVSAAQKEGLLGADHDCVNARRLNLIFGQIPVRLPQLGRSWPSSTIVIRSERRRPGQG